VSVVALTMTEYFPAAQSVQAADPLLGLNFPGTQTEQTPFVPVQPAVQTQDAMPPPQNVMAPPCDPQITHEAPFSPIKPELHSQEVFLMLPGVEEEFDGQSEHIADPRVALYVFLLHCAHVPPYALV